jgi:drug/metabolite transporter (DMT)-like permease
LWVAGLGVFALGNACDFIALGIAPLSTVTLLGSWSLVVNTVTARFLLGEVVLLFDYASIGFIVAGIVLTVVASDHTPNDWPLPRLVRHYRETKVVVLLVVMGVIVVLLLAVLHLHARVLRMQHRLLEEDSGLAPVPTRPSKYIRVLYVLVGSMVGNFTALFGKAFAGLLVFSFSGEDQFNHDPFVVVIVGVFLVSLPLQIYLINASLAVNDLLYHIPNFYVFWNVGNILSGAVFYEETKHFTGVSWAVFLGGVFLLFLGVWCTNYAAAHKALLAPLHLVYGRVVDTHEDSVSACSASTNMH